MNENTNEKESVDFKEIKHRRKRGVRQEGGARVFTDDELKSIVAVLPQEMREKLIAGYDLKVLAKVFEDKYVMLAIDTYLKSGMSFYRTASALYMHKNTLIYMFNRIRTSTGFDIRNFESAVTFKLLHYLYILK